MTAITMNTAAIGWDPPYRNVQFLEDVTITDQVASPVAVTKGFYVPFGAVKLSLYIFFDSQAGTGETFAFTMGVPDFGTEDAITDGTDIATLGNAAWDGITTLTGAGPYVVVIEIGPDVTDDDVGSATASCYYGVKMELPPVLTYTYTTTDSNNDADYRFRIVAVWRG